MDNLELVLSPAGVNCATEKPSALSYRLSASLLRADR